VLAGIPAAVRDEGEAQLTLFIEKSGCQAPVIRYRELTGEFASASAVAAVMAVSFLTERQLPTGKEDGKNAILVLGLGPFLSAMEFSRP
jgi:3-oxoacyl-[acyl-carrier-protein] synthase-1/3-oxoacyl-[acyl-carrier-protein] synthase II